MSTPRWDYDPETIGQLVDWFATAEDHLDDNENSRDYIGTRWAWHVRRLAEEQGVPPGWLSYMVSALVVEGAARGEQA